jgi:pimeloyl-ACP methyl ester carboxylesterase
VVATTQNPPQTGYAPVNGLQMYYEIHGSGGTPLLLLHGGLFNIDLQFGELIPGLAATRQVIATDFHPDGDRQENTEAVGSLTVEMIAGTPMEQEYLAKSPHPDKLQDLLDKLGTYDKGFTGWSDADITGITAPTLVTVGDCDAVKLDHVVRFLRLRGGDVNGDFVGVPSSQLAVFPGTTHFFGLARTALVQDVVLQFLDAPVAFVDLAVVS